MYGCSAETNCSACASGNGRARSKISLRRTPVQCTLRTVQPVTQWKSVTWCARGRARSSWDRTPPSVGSSRFGFEWIVHFLLSVADVAASTRLTLIAAILGSSIVFIDGTVVNVALPPIQHDLGGGLAAQQWIVDAYLLTLGSLILVGGSLGDIFGEVRIFRLGVVTFGLASVLCAVAPTSNTL